LRKGPLLLGEGTKIGGPRVHVTYGCLVDKIAEFCKRRKKPWWGESASRSKANSGQNA